MPSVLYLIVRSWAPALTMKFPTRFVNTHLHLFGYHRVGRLHVLTSFFCTFDNSQQIDRSKYTRSPLFMQNEHARTRKTWTSVRTLRYLYFFSASNSDGWLHGTLTREISRGDNGGPTVPIFFNDPVCKTSAIFHETGGPLGISSGGIVQERNSSTSSTFRRGLPTLRYAT